MDILRAELPHAPTAIDDVSGSMRSLWESITLRVTDRTTALAQCASIRRRLGLLHRAQPEALPPRAERRLRTCLHLTTELTTGITRLFDTSRHTAPFDT
ncbi:hypothetical protein [Streptomyces sp. NPDC005438]|uniref:hypothetical protein n=1 Tax=Streptomyces sp. NPDC005438 TaxID=3156880 RepID=UPI0033BC36C3